MRTARARLLSCLATGVLALAACTGDPASAPASGGDRMASTVAPASEPANAQGAASPPAAPNAPADDAPSLAVEGEGLRWFLPPNGSARPLPFGTPKADVLASLERARGPADQGTNQDCGAGPVDYAAWADGLSLLFQEGRFAGWSLDERAADAVTTAAGIGPGSTRADLDAAYTATVEQTTLGTEFSAGDLHGVLDGTAPTARITDMWAGISCAAR